jgi:hypothetical protein
MSGNSSQAFDFEIFYHQKVNTQKSKANSGATTISKLGPSLSGFLDKFASFTRSVCQTNVLNLFYMRKKP